MVKNGIVRRRGMNEKEGKYIVRSLIILYFSPDIVSVTELRKMRDALLEWDS
jgi:hypothetical protein